MFSTEGNRTKEILDENLGQPGTLVPAISTCNVIRDGIWAGPPNMAGNLLCVEGL